MKVLVVVDGSPISNQAVLMVQALGLSSQASVTVVTIVPKQIFLGGITLEKLSRIDGQSKEARRKKAADILISPVSILKESGLSVESMVREGNPAEVILRVAEASNTSLIVMGARGLKDPLVFRLGDVASKVMKHASCSVLLVRKNTVRKKPSSAIGNKVNSIDRVLLPTDGSKYSDMAVQFLVDLPLPVDCEVIVLTAIQSYATSLMTMPTLNLEANQKILEDIQKAEENEARKITTRSVNKFRTAGYKTKSVLMRGGPAESILEAAKEHDINIISIGSRGLSGVESFLLGSVSERVARYAPCSVLIVRP